MRGSLVRNQQVSIFCSKKLGLEEAVESAFVWVRTEQLCCEAAGSPETSKSQNFIEQICDGVRQLSKTPGRRKIGDLHCTRILDVLFPSVNTF